MNQDIVFDHARQARIGLPEAVFCEGKSRDALTRLLTAFARGQGHSVLFTRLDKDVFTSLPHELQSSYDYDALSRTAWGERLPDLEQGSVAVVSAGTSDGFVAWEAARTLEYLGIRHAVYEDCGVAGLWRLTERVEDINRHDCVSMAAGLDAALASVRGGRSGRPLFAVPTSTGYGAARGGETALASMLSSCSPGIGVLNIDNGYGAACAAARVIHAIYYHRPA